MSNFNDDAPTWLSTAVRATVEALPKSIRGPAQVVYEDMAKRRAQRGAEVMAAVAMSVDAVAVREALEGDPILDATFAAAVEAAARSGVAAKRRLLALVVTEAIQDESLIDEAALRVGILGQIDAPHIRCLTTLASLERQAEEDGEVQPRATRAEPNLIPRLVAAGESMPGPVIAALISHGLLEASSTWDGTYLVQQVTPAGHALLADLRRAADNGL